MKFPLFGRKMYIAAFLIFLCISVLCTVPVYKFLSSGISEKANSMRTEMEQSLGVTFSYSKLSPSILTFFDIKGIVLKSVETGNEIASIKKLTIRYSIASLLRGELNNAFKSIVVSGLTLDYDDKTDKAILQNILKNKTDSNSSDSKSSKEKISLNHSISNIDIPNVDIFLKNIKLIYKKNNITTTGVIKKASFSKIKNAHTREVKANCSLTVQEGKKVFANSNIAASGTLTENLEGSSLLMQLLNCSLFDVQLAKMQFLCKYEEENLFFSTIANTFPFLINAEYNVKSQKANATFKSENFLLSSFLSSRKKNNLIKKIAGTSLSLNTNASYDFLEKNFSYDSKGSFYLPETILPFGGRVFHSLRGDQKRINFSRLDLNGVNYDIASTLEYVFQNKNLSGILNAHRITLSNGTDVKGEFFFDPLEKGFLCFAPEICFGEKVLTAMQFDFVPHSDSLDFNFEISDYAHSEKFNPSLISFTGSYLFSTKYAQGSVSLSDLFLDSVAEVAAAFVDEKKSNALKSFTKTLSPYMLAGELYVSSDLKSVSYNMPYVFVANTQKENELLYASLSGNETSLQISNASIIFGSQNANLSFALDRDENANSSFFTLDFKTQSVPYHFTGTILNSSVTVSGDYGFSFYANKDRKGDWQGSMLVENFPFSLKTGIMWLSLESGFAYTEKDGFALHLSRFEGEDKGDAFSFAPRFLISGDITKHGALFDSVLYSDKFSTLTGDAKFILNVNEKTIGSCLLDVSLLNALSNEKIVSRVELSNPKNLPFGIDMLKNEVYVNSEFVFSDFNLNRFLKEQSANNSVNAVVSATGTLENPYIGITLEDATFMLAGTLCSVKGNSSIEEHELFVHDVNLSYGSLRARDISSTINLKTFTGDGKAVVFYQGRKRNLEVPLEFSLFNSKFSEGKKTPETFSLKLSSSGTKGSFFFKNFPFTVTLEKNQDVISFSSSKNLGLAGFVKNTGEVFASVAKDKPCRFTLAGKIFEQNIDLAVSDVFVDLHELTSFFNLEFLKIYKGIMQGSFKIAGLRGDPYFNGELFVTNADWSLPSIVPSHITKDKFNIILEHNQITMPEVLMKVRNDYCNIGMTVFMDRWFLSNVKGFVRTPPGKVAPAALDIKVAKFDGMTSVDLDILYESGIMDVTGTVYVENVKATVRANEIIEVLNNGIGLPFDIRTNLKITAGTHVNVVLDPLLRCVLVPGTSAVFKLDQSDGSYSLDGDVRLKSGDITYFNRNFYLKEGVIRSNDNEGTFNPRITVRAETRERDNDGRDVRIILSADNQTIFPVESFVPKISTIPAKSEAEIRTLLGQIAVGDVSSASDMLLMAGDYAIQSMLLRNLENSLREIFNFDIFSVRTMMLQNIVKQGVAGNVLQQDFTVGNLFDNSTVYIGKYFGSVIYADASMHVSYDESRWNDPSDKLRGISFRPEFGLELEAPFTNIRWSFSPDISAMTNGVFMPATSLTLSWRFSF